MKSEKSNPIQSMNWATLNGSSSEGLLSTGLFVEKAQNKLYGKIREAKDDLHK